MKETTFTQNKTPKHIQLAQEINKINSIVSESLGIGFNGSDPTEAITTQDRFYSGSDARNWHRSLDTVSAIIDTPSKDALRNGFKIKTNYDDLGIGEMVLEKLKELKFNKKAFRYLIDTKLYSRGATVYPIIKQSGMDQRRTFLNTPLLKSNIQKIECLNIIPEEQISFMMQNYDPHATGYGEIDKFYIQGAQMAENRYLHYVESMDIYRNRGVTMLDKILTGCKGLAIAEWTIQNLFLRYRALIVKYPAAQAVSQDPKQKAGLMKLIQQIKLQFTSKSVASVPDNYDFEYLETKFAGLKEGTDFLYEYLATTSKVPQSQIKGSAKGELASAEKDQRDYYETTVQSGEQKQKLTPLLDYLIPYILWEQEGDVNYKLRMNGINPDSITWDIEYNPLQSVNPLQDAQIKLINSQTNATEIQSGVLKPEEARAEAHPELEDFIPEGFDETSQFSTMGMEGLSNFMDQFNKLSKN
jgi:phage-related protein (TIGR01555 family)